MNNTLQKELCVTLNLELQAVIDYEVFEFGNLDILNHILSENVHNRYTCPALDNFTMMEIITYHDMTEENLRLEFLKKNREEILDVISNYVKAVTGKTLSEVSVTWMSEEVYQRVKSKDLRNFSHITENTERGVLVMSW